MKKLSFLLLLLIPARLHAIHTIVFRNASDLSTGSVANSLLDPSSVTKQGPGPFISSGAGTVNQFHLNTTGVGAATYGSATLVPQIAVAADGRITSISNVGVGAGSGSTGTICTNLVITTNSTNTNQLVITADALDIMGNVYVGYSTTAAMNILGAGGVDAGAEGANEWRAVYAISNAAGTQAGVVLSTSFGTTFLPVMPTGYTKWRLLGWVRNDGSSNIIPFRKKGKQVNYFQGQNVLNASGNQAAYTDVGLENLVSSSAVNAQLAVCVGDLTATFGKGSRIELKPKGYITDAVTTSSDYIGVYMTDGTAGRQACTLVTTNLLDQRRVQYQQAATDDSTVDQVIINVNGFQEDVP